MLLTSSIKTRRKFIKIWRRRQFEFLVLLLNLFLDLRFMFMLLSLTVWRSNSLSFCFMSVSLSVSCPSLCSLCSVQLSSLSVWLAKWLPNLYIACPFLICQPMFSFLLPDSCRWESWPKVGAKYFINKDVLGDWEDKDITKEHHSATTEEDCYKECRVKLDFCISFIGIIVLYHAIL